MTRTLNDKLSSVQSKQQLSVFVEELRVDLHDNPENWENPTLDRYLDALSRWIDDIDGFLRNTNTSIDTISLWQIIGMMLLAARIYE